MRAAAPADSKKRRRCDLLAVLLGLLMVVLFAYTAKYGVSSPDEAFYYTVTDRLLKGERLLADEWNVTQLCYLLSLLPHWVFVRITGGTEGIVLSMRYLFIAINTAFYSYVYVKLRRFGFWGVAAAFSFSAIVVQTMFSITYFTAAPMAAFAAVLILVSGEREKKTPALLFAGVLVACAVLAEPYLIAGFLAWFAIVTVRRLREKKTPILRDFGFVLDGRVYFTVAAGAACVFAAFMVYMVACGSFENFAAAFPYLASGSEIGLLDTVLFKKAWEACGYFGIPTVAGLAACVIAAAVVRLKKNENVKIRRTVFAAACVCYAAGLVYAGVCTLKSAEAPLWIRFAEYHGFSLLLFSPVLWLLSRKKDPRIFALWVAGVAFTLPVDASSAAILASGAGIVRAACLLQLPVLLRELKTPAEGPAEKTKKARGPAPGRVSPVFTGVLAVCAAAVVLWHAGHVAIQTVYKPYEKLLLHVKEPLSRELTAGPFKGLYTTDGIAAVYSDTLEDLDEIRALANGAPAAVLDLAPYTYLYLDLPYGAYTSWFEYYETERLAAFWQLRPARQPAYIYIPYYEKGLFAKTPDELLKLKLDRLFEWIDGETTEGRAGYIIRVTHLRSPLPEDAS